MLRASRVIRKGSLVYEGYQKDAYKLAKIYIITEGLSKAFAFGMFGYSLSSGSLTTAIASGVLLSIGASASDKNAQRKVLFYKTQAQPPIPDTSDDLVWVVSESIVEEKS